MNTNVNYQLYRTNVSLGGQMKMDLVLDSDNSSTYVADYHLTPISDSVPYNKYKSETLLNYSHQYNIQTLYKDTKGYFYSNEVIPKCDNAWPIVTNDVNNDIIDAHDGTMEMGCSRCHYRLYGKQFEFLCPVWIEHLDSNEHLEFDFKIYTGQNSEPIVFKTLKLNNIPQCEFHNKFVKYFDDYLKYIKIKGEMNEDPKALHGWDVINIDLLNHRAKVVGLNVSNGNIESKNIDSLITNLIYRERPLIEFDGLIIDSLKSNALITRQLFNFAFYFNIDDISSQFVGNRLKKQDLNIQVSVRIVNANNESKILELKDFYTNYEFIHKQLRGDLPNTEEERAKMNVLDYLKDNKCIDFQLVNKFSPSIIHWSLVADNSYIFNLYEGFAGVIIKNQTEKRITKRYGIAPNISNGVYSPALNNDYWCNSISLDSWNNVTSLLADPAQYEPGASNMMNTGVNGVYYKDDSSESRNRLLVYNCVPRVDVWNRLNLQTGKQYVKIQRSGGDESIVIIILEDDFLVVCAENENSLTFKSVRRLLNSHDGAQDEPEVISDLRDRLNSAIEPESISFTKSVYIMKTPSPSEASTEVDYYKNDLVPEINVYRYDGLIRPSFISPAPVLGTDDDYLYTPYNYVHYKTILNSIDFGADPFSRYASSKYEPVFPSIGYYAIEKNVINYETNPTLDNTPWIFNNLIESKWYNKSIVKNLDTVITGTLDGNIQDIQSIVNDIIANHYGISEDKNNEVKYLSSLYDYSLDLEYTENEGNSTNIGIKYNITLSLK